MKNACFTGWYQTVPSQATKNRMDPGLYSKKRMDTPSKIRPSLSDTAVLAASRVDIHGIRDESYSVELDLTGTVPKPFKHHFWSFHQATPRSRNAIDSDLVGFIAVESDIFVGLFLCFTFQIAIPFKTSKIFKGLCTRQSSQWALTGSTQSKVRQKSHQNDRDEAEFEDEA